MTDIMIYVSQKYSDTDRMDHNFNEKTGLLPNAFLYFQILHILPFPSPELSNVSQSQNVCSEGFRWILESDKGRIAGQRRICECAITLYSGTQIIRHCEPDWPLKGWFDLMSLWFAQQ